MKAPYASGHPFLAGQTVTPGTYVCASCGHKHTVPQGKVTNLPVCPGCQNDRWQRG